jgi:hypothetical protein
VPFLRNQMIELCCAKAVRAKYMGGAAADDTPRGAELSYEQARTELNTYTTTLHAINSAIVKLSKLTYAHKVYRGINNRVLPEEFWKANEYGVRGGIEGAFMSTTVDREVALSYARADGHKAGLIFEIQQGMVDRGAELAFISQYPHEQEILFAPLAGFEVKYTRVEGQVLVVVVSLAVNLTAQTIEQVISKRRKLVCDMCDQILIKTRQTATVSESWAPLREAVGESAVEAAEQLLQTVRSSVASKPPEHYNVNANLVDGTTWVLGVADTLDMWGVGLQEVLDHVRAMYGGHRHGKPMQLAELLQQESIDLSNRDLSLTAAYGLAALVYLSPSLTELIASSNALGDAGVAAIATALEANPASALSSLHFAHCGAGERAGKALISMLEANLSLQRLDLRTNYDKRIDVSKEMLDAIVAASERRSVPLKLVI